MNRFIFRIYVNGDSVRGRSAVNYFREFCDRHLGTDGYDLTVIDVLEHPEQAEKDRIFATPTLIKIVPQPRLRIVGDLSNDKLLSDVIDLKKET